MHQFPSVSELPVQSGLPDPFQKADGTIISRPNEWVSHREYLKGLLEHYQYGSLPPTPSSFDWQTKSEDTVMDGDAVVEHAEITLERVGKSTSVRVAVMRPDRTGRFPVIIKNDKFLFGRNDPPDSPLDTGTAKNEERLNHQQFADSEAIERGYVICKFLREDIARDTNGKRDRGVFPLYPEYRDWGVIAAWAWSYQFLIDALIERAYVDPSKIVATGHSRGGKTALCAGIYDERVAVTVPNSSGSGGTGSWRFFDDDHDKQTLAYNEANHAHWWTPRLMEFVGHENRLPFDAHIAKAAIAPRALLNTHSRHDWWANPYGTALTTKAAQPVFDWLGVADHNQQHWRNGGHDQNETDWLALFDFCDRYFFNQPADCSFQVNPHPDRYTFDAALFQYSHDKTQ